MPGNTITMNNYKEWYVGDSNMPKFLALMKKIGYKPKLIKAKKK
jgi:hypothetical protein